MTHARNGGLDKVQALFIISSINEINQGSNSFDPDAPLTNTRTVALSQQKALRLFKIHKKAFQDQKK